jgi:hypothetical protein
MLSTFQREGPAKTVETMLIEEMELRVEVLGVRHTIVGAPLQFDLIIIKPLFFNGVKARVLTPSLKLCEHSA